MKNEMKDEANIIGGELLIATVLSMPLLSQTGTRIIAPPRPKAPPNKPARNP